MPDIVRQWTRRWLHLKEIGLTKEQAIEVYYIVDDTRGFGAKWLADSAREQLEEVYGE